MATMTVTGTYELTAFDVSDIAAVTAFYKALTGWEVVRDVGDWITFQAPDGQQVALQQIPDHVGPEWPGQKLPQQFHLDLLVDGYQAAAERAVSLGATRLAEGASWITVADPAGHPIDLCQRDGLGDATGLYAVTVDAPDAAGLARFYAALCGMELAYEGPEGALLTAGTKNLMFQQVADYNPPKWADPTRPQQAHVDIIVADLDAAAARALELGATRVDNGSANFQTFADPAGHHFDLSL